MVTMHDECPTVKLSCHVCAATGRQETHDGNDLGPCPDCMGLGEVEVKDNFRLCARLGGSADFAGLLGVLHTESRNAAEDADRAAHALATDPESGAARKELLLATQRKEILASVMAGLDLYRLPLPGKGCRPEREEPTPRTKKPRQTRQRTKDADWD